MVNKKPKLCAVCKVEIPKGLRKYCSPRCELEAKKARAKKKKREKRKGVTVDKLDKLWSKLIRQRDGKCMCPKCTKKEYLNAHHIFSRTNRSVRWLMGNGITLCSGHHVFSDEFSAHKTPVEFVDFLYKLHGKEYIDDLRTIAHGVNDKDLEYWWEYLKQYEKEMSDDSN